MLTGKLVRVRFGGHRVVPLYIDTGHPQWRDIAESLLDVFRRSHNRTRGELEEEINELSGEDPRQLVHRGFAKLLEDRCDFEVVSSQPPEELRQAVFAAAAAFRKPRLLEQNAAPAGTPFNRDVILTQVADKLKITPEAVDRGLFADLKSEQRLVNFKDISAEHLLQRYNVALAQAVLLRSTKVHVTIDGESPRRYRQLLRHVKFHRLVCEIEKAKPEGYRLHLDGPLSLFSATQKYGVQLALFLPAVLHCRNFFLEAELRWGAQRKPKVFTLSPEDGLVAHQHDSGMYAPPELAMFVELFRKKIDAWNISEESAIFPLGNSYWVPDYRLTHRQTQKAVLLEVLGFWRRSSVETHLERLREYVKQPFLLAVSEQLRVDDADLDGLPAKIHRFRQMPLPDEIARLASEAVGLMV